MNQKRNRFPVVVGVINTNAHAFSEKLIVVMRDLFTKLSERSDSPVLVVYPENSVADKQIARAAEEAGLKSQLLGAAGDHEILELRSDINMEIAETCNLLLLISHGTDVERSLHAFAQDFDCTIVQIDAETGTLKGTLPQHLEAGAEWMADLFAVAGLSPEADLETIQARMDEVANRAAPVTRSWWRWLLLLQGLAVLVPLGWLVRRAVYIPVGWVAGITFLVVLLLLGFSWWVRWRSMQKTWARARLLAEVARSLLATANCLTAPTLRALAAVPSLRPLRWLARVPRESLPFPQWRDLYLQQRIDDQARYFQRKQEEAEAQRKQLTGWTTLLLDLALAFAFAGAVLSIARYTPIWLQKLEDVRLEIVLGMTIALATLALLVVQLLRGVLEVNRRTARFAQQRELLKHARARLNSTNSPAMARQIVEDTEMQLLAEVFEWYFHAETAEHFFRLRADRSSAVRIKHKANEPYIITWLRDLVKKGGFAGWFLLRLTLGRVLWMVASGAAAIIFLVYYRPSDVRQRTELKPLAHLLDSDGKPWSPDRDKAEYGCVVIVHGMYGEVDVRKKDNWPKQCADAINRRMGTRAPNICLVDWHEAAQPANLYPLGLSIGKTQAPPTPDNRRPELSATSASSTAPAPDDSEDPAELLENISAIRSQAHEVGDLLAFYLAKRILEEPGTIRQDRPLHFIGHSAGGFVVARGALLLTKLKFFPNRALLYATILDTPAPDAELLVQLPAVWPTDFCLSSGKIWSTPFRVPQLAGSSWWSPLSTPRFLLEKPPFEITDGASKSQLHLVRRWPKLDNPLVERAGSWGSKQFWDEFWEAHRAAYKWFIETIENPGPKDQNEGFNRSPILQFTPSLASGKHPN